MSRCVYFTTVNRGASVERGGEFVCLDWDTKTVRAKTAIFPASPTLRDPNPRGNTRGGRGVAVVGEELYVASYHTLHIFGRNLERRRDLTHGLFAGLHELHYTGNGSLWVSATAIDAALEIDVASGRIVRACWPRKSPRLQERWGLQPLVIDEEADNRARFLARAHQTHPSHLHLNAVATWRGATYALFNHFGAIVDLDSAEVVVEDPTLRGAHNLHIDEGGTAYVNDTLRRVVRVFDLVGRRQREVLALCDFEPLARLARSYWISDALICWAKRLGLRAPVARPLFVRGLYRLGHLLFVGMSPATIACINMQTYEFVDLFQYSRDVATCVHGLVVCDDP